MSAKLLYGSSLAAHLRKEMAEDVSSLKDNGITPCLAVMLVGNDQASRIYINNKQRACEEVGMMTIVREFDANATQELLHKQITAWNKDANVHGIIVQLPLPEHIDKHTILDSVNCNKDVDGFHTSNLGLLLHDRPNLIPCTPQAIIELLRWYEIAVFGRSVTIVNHSIIVGKPLAMLLSNAGATVTICHEHTRDIHEFCRRAEILVSAVGRRDRWVVNRSCIKDKAVVIDVGISRAGGKIQGDVDETVRDIAEWVSPVPGGVGILTCTFLLKNTIKACKIQIESKSKGDQ